MTTPQGISGYEVLRGQVQVRRREPIQFEYFANDDLHFLTHGNGLKTTYAYYPHGPIQSIAVENSVPVEPHKLVYAYDGLLNVDTVQETIAGQVQSPLYDFGYDGASRLTSAQYPSLTDADLPTSEPFGYDDAGNRDDDPAVATPWSYDANNRIEASPADPVICHDADGNLETTRSSGDCATGPVVRSFTWNPTNRLESTTSGATTASYLYDPFGRRVRKVVDDGVTAITTWYLWDGDQLLAEYDSSGSRLRRYAYAQGFAPIQLAEGASGSETVYDVHSDHLDTPRTLTDSSGTPVWRAYYEAFGRAHLSDDPDGDPGTPDPGIEFNIRFPGQYYDAETGLHSNRHRYYSPELGRYISADPIGQFGTLRWKGVASSRPRLRTTSRTSLLPRTLVEADSGVRQAAIRFGERVNAELLDVPGVATGLIGGPLILGATDSNLFAYGLGDPINHADPTGENILVVGVIIVAAAAAVGYSLWAYSQAAEACRDFCRDQAAQGLCMPGDTRCFSNCMAGANGLITSTGGGSSISTGVGGGISATTDNE